ncbi:phosphopantetheine-binding protein [Paenibacillus puerhi]|uniref:phosphopantetheine-binding protein n=1 Tax=Paenibacillus puerhi TaxID=2692622 RepID=UPI0013584FF7|nr:phosphopantetheine-binding protein [Paenibacillus puerhi]
MGEQVAHIDSSRPSFADFRAQAAHKLKKEEGLLTPEAEWVRDVGISSVDMVKIVMLLRQKYGIKLSTTEAGRLKTVGDAFRYVEQGGVR